TRCLSDWSSDVCSSDLEKLRHAQEFPVSRFGEGDSGQLFAFVGRERNYVVVETRDGDAAVFVAEPGEQLAKGQGRVVHRTAVDARVQIARGAVELDFEGNDSAQRGGQRRVWQVGHAGVGNNDGVAAH